MSINVDDTFDAYCIGIVTNNIGKVVIINKFNINTFITITSITRKFF